MHTTTHPHHYRYLAMLTERLLRRTLDESEWSERCAHQREAIATKERIWSRTPATLIAHLEPYRELLREQLELTDPALQEMKGYVRDEERAEYTRLVMYRASLLEEIQRVEALLDAHSADHSGAAA